MRRMKIYINQRKLKSFNLILFILNLEDDMGNKNK